MLFHTLAFGAFFLAFLICYLPVRGSRWGVFVIVLFSSFFYGTWNWRFLPLLWFTIVLDFSIGHAMGKIQDQRTRTKLLWTSVTCNLGILGYFKYWNFLVHSFVSDPVWAGRLNLGDIILPLGISFYVFQSMSYIIDVYRGVQKPLKSIIDFAAFVTFFPHLIAGPIQRIQQLVPQILKPDAITWNRITSGILVFSTGLFRKALGDTLAAFHDPIFSNLASSQPAEVVFGIVSFGLQIYLDFSGYSEMAVGIARMIGIDLVTNFDAPYLSTSIRDFWRRWHISLSMWLRDYLYISLGGSRVGISRQVGNLLFTMALCGLWHGAGWNFALWGLLHGVFLGANVLFRRFLPERKPDSGLASWIYRALSLTVTFTATNYAWIYFRIPTLEGSLIANAKLLRWIQSPSWPSVPPGIVGIFVVVLMMDILTRLKGEIFPLHIEFTGGRALRYGVAAACLVIISIVLTIGRPTQQFIYFQF